VSEIICPDCGERNAGPVEFCAACGGFLAWDAGDEVPAPAGVAPQAAGLPSAAPIAARSTGSSAQEPRPAGPPQRHATEQPADHQLASAFAAGLPAGAVPQRTLAQPAREWATAQFSGSGFEPSTRTDRHGPPPPAEPPSMLSAPAEPAAPTEAPCPRCGVVNDAALRFCRKCGLALKGPSLHDEGAGRPQPAPERRPWWRRWFRPGDNTRRAARSAFRHSLPLRYRLVRWGLGLLGIGAIVAALTLFQQNPVRWVSDRVNDLRGSLVAVQGLRAYDAPQVGAGQAPPGGAASPGTTAPPAAGADAAENLLDNRYDTAWSTAWSAANQQDPSGASCVPPSTPSAVGAPGSILIVPSGPVTVREISISPGRAKSDTRRPLEWRPKTIQLAFSDGTCQLVTLDDSDELQPKQIEPVETTQIRLSVVNAYEPDSKQPTDVTAISDIVLYQRP
jgi:hypothetical protein